MKFACYAGLIRFGEKVSIKRQSFLEEQSFSFKGKQHFFPYLIPNVIFIVIDLETALSSLLGQFNFIGTGTDDM